MRKILFVSALLFATPAFADKLVKVGDSEITIVLPAGYCELEAGNKSDARVLAAIRGMIEPIGNNLLSAGAVCNELRDWRGNKVTRLKNMTQFQVFTGETQNGSQAETDAAVKGVCDELRERGKQTADEMNPSVKARAAKVMEKIEYGKIELIGVTGEEPGVCYVALLQKFRAEDKTDVTQLVTYANMLVKGRWIYFYQFGDYENPDSVTAALTLHKQNVKAFRDANQR